MPISLKPIMKEVIAIDLPEETNSIPLYCSDTYTHIQQPIRRNGEGVREYTTFLHYIKY